MCLCYLNHTLSNQTLQPFLSEVHLDKSEGSVSVLNLNSAAHSVTLKLNYSNKLDLDFEFNLVKFKRYLHKCVILLPGILGSCTSAKNLRT